MDNKLYINDSFFGSIVGLSADAENDSNSTVNFVADWMLETSDEASTAVEVPSRTAFDLWHN